MFGTTLSEIREHIDALASDDGTYSVICGRTGEQPIPVVGMSFEGRTTARSATRAAEQYRTALRQYDPSVPYYDLIVCQDIAPLVSTDHNGSRSQHEDDRTHSTPNLDQSPSSLALDGRPSDPNRQQLIEFCHGVAAAVFETLCDTGCRRVETAIMDAYFDLAETVTDLDELCLCLLESMATELATRLDPTEQADLLSNAATRLAPLAPVEHPVTATFTRLQRVGLVGKYTRSPWSIALDDGTRSVVVQLSEYALSPQNGRFPMLPVVLDLYRQELDWPLSVVHVADAGESWRIRLVLSREAEPEELASVPIQSRER